MKPKRRIKRKAVKVDVGTKKMNFLNQFFDKNDILIDFNS